MPSVPEPRKPTCTRHHVHMAACPDCCEQREWEREQARKRIDQASRP